MCNTYVYHPNSVGGRSSCKKWKRLHMLLASAFVKISVLSGTFKSILLMALQALYEIFAI